MQKTASFIHRILPVFFIAGYLVLTSAVPAKEGLSEDVLKYTNQFRRSRGLPGLQMRNDLNEIARRHSEDMAKGRRSFGHGGFNQREVQVRKVINPYNGMAENVAYGFRTGKDVVAMWKHSSAHRKNLLGNYKYTGIGTARDRRGFIYYTQIFVR